LLIGGSLEPRNASPVFAVARLLPPVSAVFGMHKMDLIALPAILAQSDSPFRSSQQPTWLLLTGGTVAFLTLVPSLLILAGGWQMLRLEAYGLALIGAIMALIPCTLGWLLG